jgi:hypothetical protein
MKVLFATIFVLLAHSSQAEEAQAQINLGDAIVQNVLTPQGAILTIDVKETAVDGSNSYFNTTMQVKWNSTFDLPQNSTFNAQIVRYLPTGLDAKASSSKNGDCTGVLGKDCLNDFTVENYFISTRGHFVPNEFPFSSACQKAVDSTGGPSYVYNASNINASKKLFHH